MLSKKIGEVFSLMLAPLIILTGCSASMSEPKTLNSKALSACQQIETVHLEGSKNIEARTLIPWTMEKTRNGEIQEFGGNLFFFSMSDLSKIELDLAEQLTVLSSEDGAAPESLRELADPGMAFSLSRSIKQNKLEIIDTMLDIDGPIEVGTAAGDPQKMLDLINEQIEEINARGLEFFADHATFMVYLREVVDTCNSFEPM